jgi:hypothetical protein
VLCNCNHAEKFTIFIISGPETTEGRVEYLLLFEIKITIQVDDILRNTLMLRIKTIVCCYDMMLHNLTQLAAGHNGVAIMD